MSVAIVAQTGVRRAAVLAQSHQYDLVRLE